MIFKEQKNCLGWDLSLRPPRVLTSTQVLYINCLIFQGSSAESKDARQLSLEADYVQLQLGSDSIYWCITHFHPYGAVCHRVSPRPGQWSGSSSEQLPPK